MNRFIEKHSITPVVDREFTFDDALQAFAHMSEQRHFGKLVINVAGAREPLQVRHLRQERTFSRRWQSDILPTGQ